MEKVKKFKKRKIKLFDIRFTFKDELTGLTISYFDGDGIFNISNPHNEIINTDEFCNKILNLDFNFILFEVILFFDWSYSGEGFGQIYHSISHGKKEIDYEGMFDEFVEKAIKKALKKVFSKYPKIN